MIEISNAFILVWLVVLAVICIYLLYMSLTRNNESDSLKSTIANLVRQNKKRDELINFLMERVETLSGALNSITNPLELNSDNRATILPNITGEMLKNDNIEISDVPETVLSNATENISIDDVLNSITNDSNFETLANSGTIPEDTNLDNKPDDTKEIINSSSNELNNIKPNNDLLVQNTVYDTNINDVPANKSLHNLNLDDVLNSIPSTFKDDDLISTILGADDSASQQCKTDVDDVTDLPTDKLKLLAMNVKQLKQLAKDMNIKSRGTKIDLVDAIWDKMIKNEVPVEQLDEHVNTFNFIDNVEKTANEHHTLNDINLIVEELPNDI